MDKIVLENFEDLGENIKDHIENVGGILLEIKDILECIQHNLANQCCPIGYTGHCMFCGKEIEDYTRAEKQTYCLSCRLMPVDG